MTVSNEVLRNALFEFRAKIAANLDYKTCLEIQNTSDWSKKEELGDFNVDDWIFLKRQVISADEKNEKGRYAYVIIYACDDRDNGLGSGKEPLYANMWIYESGEIEFWDVEQFK